MDVESGGDQCSSSFKCCIPCSFPVRKMPFDNDMCTGVATTATLTDVWPDEIAPPPESCKTLFVLICPAPDTLPFPRRARRRAEFLESCHAVTFWLLDVDTALREHNFRATDAVLRRMPSPYHHWSGRSPQAGKSCRKSPFGSEPASH
jgi:hypothetical protein